MALEQLKQLIVAKLSPEEFLDILGFDLEDLVDALEDEICEFEMELTAAVYD
jgi:hypothetical protein